MEVLVPQMASSADAIIELARRNDQAAMEEWFRQHKGDKKLTTSLNFKDCHLLETLPEGSHRPSIIPFLTYFWSFTISEGIGGLVNLQTLNCRNCRKLESLPDSKIVLFSFIIL